MSDIHNDFLKRLIALRPYASDVLRHAGDDLDVLTALTMVLQDGDDSYARDYIDERLAAPKAIAEAFPDPFAPGPLSKEVDGPFRFAETEGSRGEFAGLSGSELNRNVIIVGEAGGGKTSTVIYLMVSMLEAG